MNRQTTTFQRTTYLRRNAWWLTTFAPLLPNVVGSVFNVWYNLTNIQPLLSPPQLSRFMVAVTIYNAIIYPILIYFYVKWMLSVRQTWHRLNSGQPVEVDRLMQDQRKVINSPWAIVTIGCIGWFLCIPVFLAVMFTGPGILHPHIAIHLPISFLIAGMIAVSQSLFVSELCSLRLLHPAFFPQGGASNVKGGWSLTLGQKGLVWAISVVVCPVVSLLLLIVAPQNVEWIALFAVSVSAVAITFGLASGWLMGKLVTEPVSQLRQAAERVGNGDLNVEVHLSRADDFGPLIDEFNRMVKGLGEKKFLEETFGRHVGTKAASEILGRRSGQIDDERMITVMFADLRNFTAMGSGKPAREVVSLLNLFLTEMVEIIERHDGMVNKFLGDGLMALFGAAGKTPAHASSAVAAAQEMLGAMADINAQVGLTGSDVELKIGIGIHTGDAVVGSIGAPHRMEYTAIGDTVNVASRIESLTKTLRVGLLVSESTRDAMDTTGSFQEFEPQLIKGKSQPIRVYSPRHGSSTK